MVNYNLVADLSSHNPDSLSFFRQLSDVGVKAVIIKLTEGSNPGTAYANPKAAKQIKNAKSVGMKVHAYHFARFCNNADAVLEADWFLKNVKKQGLRDNSAMVVDVESKEIPNDATVPVNAFLKQVQKHGYPNVDVYSSASWYWERRLDQYKLIPNNFWIANYGVSKPGVKNTGTWQFTDNYMGMKVDMSYDFFNFYTGECRKKPSSAQYHIVLPGESWWGIAHKYGLNMNHLAELNGTTIKAVIHPGDRLRIR